MDSQIPNPRIPNFRSKFFVFCFLFWHWTLNNNFFKEVWSFVVLTTLAWFLDDFGITLMTAGWLLDDFEITSGWLWNDFGMTPEWLRVDFEMTPGWDNMMTLWWFLDHFLFNWMMPNCFVGLNWMFLIFKWNYIWICKKYAMNTTFFFLHLVGWCQTVLSESMGCFSYEGEWCSRWCKSSSKFILPFSCLQ